MYPKEGLFSEGDANELGTPHNNVNVMEYATIFNTWG